VSIPQILLVDDDQALLQALPHLITLQLSDVRIDTAPSAHNALELLQEHAYDTIISDVKMPGMDGLELLAQISTMQPDTPTLLITGHGDQALIIQALRGGAYDFIQKPIDRVYFVAALHRALQTRQLRRQVRQQHQELEHYAHSLEHLVEQRTREFLAANEAMETLVRVALDLSQVEAHTLLLHRSRCDLVEVCQQVLAAYAAQAGPALDFEVGREPVEVEIDRDRISQVLIHLIFTACKASRRGAPLKVLLLHTSTEAIVTLREMEVEEMSEHPLERFYLRPQAEVQIPIEASEGVGFVLSQHIVAQHEGQIQIQNIPTGGRSFSLMLPLAGQSIEPSGSPFQPPQWLIS
jgi:FixJ family two-component response regulator